MAPSDPLPARRFLFLQGPISPFFAEVGAGLRALGHTVHRINLNLGDRLFWRGPGAVDFRGRPAEWPAFLAGFLDTHAITDLVLLGGDQLDSRMDAPPTPLLTELQRLQAPLGVYGVWGNHDYGSFGLYSGRQYGPYRPDWPAKREELRHAFARHGVTILRNQGVGVRDDLHLGGIDDLWHGEPDVKAALEDAGNRARILVSHNPDILPSLPPGIGLTLCGHTHGGQVRFPLIGAPIVPSKYGQRYAMGWVEGAHATPAYVSRGLGVSGVPMRNLCQPEITLLDLVPA